jgi:hypothetical protein
VKAERNPVLKEESFEDGATTHMRNFFECVVAEPPVEAGIAAAKAAHIGNLAHHRGQTPDRRRDSIR